MSSTNNLLRQPSTYTNPNVLPSPHLTLRRQETSESGFSSSDSDSEEIDPLEMNSRLELTRVRAQGAASQITNRTDESSL